MNIIIILKNKTSSGEDGGAQSTTWLSLLGIRVALRTSPYIYDGDFCERSSVIDYWGGRKCTSDEAVLQLAIGHTELNLSNGA